MFTLRGITDKEKKREMKKQRRCISLQEQHENFILVVRNTKWEMLATSWVKISGSDNESEQKHKQQSLFWAHTRFIHKTCINQEVCQVSRRSRATTTTKKCTKKAWCTSKVVFLLIRPFDFWQIQFYNTVCFPLFKRDNILHASPSFNRLHTLNEVWFGMRRTSRFVPRAWRWQSIFQKQLCLQLFV